MTEELTHLEASIRKAARNVILAILASTFSFVMVVHFYSIKLDQTGILQGMLRNQVDVNIAIKRMASDIIPLIETARIRSNGGNESFAEALDIIEEAVQDIIDEKYGTILSSKTIIYSNDPDYIRVARAKR